MDILILAISSLNGAELFLQDHTEFDTESSHSAASLAGSYLLSELCAHHRSHPFRIGPGEHSSNRRSGHGWEEGILAALQTREARGI
jgi:hypothetical protein